MNPINIYMYHSYETSNGRTSALKTYKNPKSKKKRILRHK